ncbi:MAG: hypothetical protein J5935_03100 [Lachnospiraceae bacterium]|nr:hypothetical protein [Lachnospiraceae bacterium]
MNAFTLPDEKWRAYYEERLPENRQKILRDLEGSAASQDAAFYSAAQTLFRLRHPQKKTENLPDIFLWQLIQILYILRQKSLFGISPAGKLKKAFKELRIPEELLLREEGRCALYWEIRNLTARYRETGKDINYRKKWFGIQALNDDERQKEMLSDLYLIGEKGPDLCLREEEKKGAKDEAFCALLSVWKEAVKDACPTY